MKENFRFLLKLTSLYFLIQLIVRSILLWERPAGILDTFAIFVNGALWDVYFWSFLAIPLVFISVYVSSNKHHQFEKSTLSRLLFFIFSTVFAFTGFCELVFWNEFHSRFNFIAVDYLIYTNEVLANIRESYPMGLIISGVLLFSALVTFGFSKITFKSTEDVSPTTNKHVLFLVSLCFPVLFSFSIGRWLEYHEENFHKDQLARNGLVEFVRAFRSNKIDYNAFYPTLPNQTVQKNMEQKVVPLSDLPFSLKKQRPNVVMIVVESLGAKFIAPLNGFKDVTPNLNKLSDESIFFENFYATGTRTVRGLEALTLSVPPTPGYAVVKRPDNENLFSMGNTFKNNNYDPMFMYGGNGFFDNMNSFFSGNGFQIIDQDDFEKDEVTFTNAWGVCDEDLFHKAQKVIKARQPNDKPFLMFLLTTSNHRPFTYPDNKIDITSGTSRAGAVKYTDYAIGNFLKEAVKEPWAKNTVFIVVADHSTEGRGQFDLGMSDYHIPLWIYSPQLIKPLKVSKLGSQIDLLPTMIHLLGLKDDSPFFGQSMFNMNWSEERAFIGNYQYVGFYKNKVLTTLGPNRTIRNFSYDPISKKQKPFEKSQYVDEAISYYQLASHKLDHGEYKREAKPMPVQH